MANRFAELFPQDTADMPSAGTVLTYPAMDVTVDPTDIDGDEYNFLVEYNFNETGVDFTIDESTTIKWNTAKTKVFIARKMAVTEGGSNYDFSYKMSYNASTDIMNLLMSVNMEGTTYTTTVTMQGITGGENAINLDNKSSFTDTDSGNKCEYHLTGHADNSGGVVMIEMTIGGDKVYYKEEFDANGLLLAQATSDDGTTWDGDSIDFINSEYEVETTELTLTPGDIEAVGSTTDPFGFVVVPASVDPNTDIGSIIGYGLWDPAIDMLLESGCWGTSAQIATADVWVESFISGEFTYESTTATVTLAP